MNKKSAHFKHPNYFLNKGTSNLYIQMSLCGTSYLIRWATLLWLACVFLSTQRFNRSLSWLLCSPVSVCVTFLGKFYQTLKDSDVKFNSADIEKALTASCKDAKGKENRFVSKTRLHVSGSWRWLDRLKWTWTGDSTRQNRCVWMRVRHRRWNVREARLRWFGCMQKRDGGNVKGGALREDSWM